MAITLGFNCSLSDQVVIDIEVNNVFFGEIQTGGSGTASAIQSNPNQKIVSTYVLVDNPGDIVYENKFGEFQFIQQSPAGLLPIAATRIVASADVRGVTKTTTATTMTWFADYKY